MKRKHLLPVSIATTAVAVAFCVGTSCSGSDGGGSNGGSGGAGAGGSATAGSGGSSAAGSGGSSAGGSGGSAPSAGSGGSAGGAAGSTAGAGGSSAGAGGGAAGGGGAKTDGGADSGTSTSTANFFVTSGMNMTGNLGGLAGADMKCQQLATAVALGSKTWCAYLSATNGAGGMPVHARDRIGPGPFINVKGGMLAATVEALHARKGDADLFLDETGKKINGRWTGSPTPNHHDILTGSQPNGMLAPNGTCMDWTSGSESLKTVVGHSDGFGPDGPATPENDARRSWNSAHQQSGSCANTEPGGGRGAIYCFALPAGQACKR